jgi:hypothetical protein
MTLRIFAASAMLCVLFNSLHAGSPAENLLKKPDDWFRSDAGQETLETFFRGIVSTDIGGTDPDDFQSMVHLLV